MCFKKTEENRKVILVGERYKNINDLSLGYLKGALELADAIVENIYINTRDKMLTDEILTVVDFVICKQPLIVGFSMNNCNSASGFLQFARLLKKRGYKGHITAGGEFATLARQWLLSKYEWIDSVLKFAGEVPLTGLYRRLKDGIPIDKIAGLTLRGVVEGS
ncbi:MAG: hypothetical protein JXR91_02085 [Deltaproteobacteria bacterium]|nr:hypothetical protein [Deltaproteobacteria bacterium]